MDHLLFSDTLLHADGTITCTHPESQCRLTFRDPNDLKGAPNTLDIRKRYPFPQVTHYSGTCECHDTLRKFWSFKKRDHIIHFLETTYGGLDVLAGINEKDVATFWYGDEITEASKADAWTRVTLWEQTLRMLATCKIFMGLGTIPRDMLLTAKAYVREGAVMWTFEQLPRDFEPQTCDHQPISTTASPGSISKNGDTQAPQG